MSQQQRCASCRLPANDKCVQEHGKDEEEAELVENGLGAEEQTDKRDSHDQACGCDDVARV